MSMTTYHITIGDKIKAYRNENNLSLKEFGRLAINSMLANNLIWQIEEAYHLNDTNLEREGENLE